jgi:hypothetical protein
MKTSRSRVLVLGTFAALVVACLTATVAEASRPIPLPPNGPLTWPAGTLCAFPLRIVTTENKSLLHEFSNGDILITGKLTQRVTNLDTGASEAFKASGPLRVMFHDDGSSTVISTGRILITLSSAADPGGPGIFIYTGRVVYQIDADGNTTSVSRIPNSLNICTVLA